MALVQAASDVPEQGAVDDRDTFLHGVRDLLSIYSSKTSSEKTWGSSIGKNNERKNNVTFVCLQMLKLVYQHMYPFRALFNISPTFILT